MEASTIGLLPISGCEDTTRTGDIIFVQLAENHLEAELRIVGMEVKGEDKLLLRVQTASNVNNSPLSAEYFDNYNHIKSLPEQDS